MTEQAEFRSLDQINWARSLKRPGPIHMLNMLRFKETAVLPDGRQLPGREAYQIYKQGVAPILRELGAVPIVFGRIDGAFAGIGENWNEIFIMAYPSVASVVGIRERSDYKQIVAIRKAAVFEFRLIGLDPNEHSPLCNYDENEKFIGAWAAQS